MTSIVSQSLYPVQGFEQRFYHGNRYHCLSAKVTLSWDEEGRLHPLEKQPGFSLHDVWQDRPQFSSLIYPSDLIPYKPTTDVLIVGTAQPPEGIATASWYGALRIGQLEKHLKFYGPRYWHHGVLEGWTLSAPEPTEGVSLLYENAFGGYLGETDHYEDGQYYPDNPIGCGFVGASKVDRQQRHRAAQVEAWDAPLKVFGKAVRPGGFGPLAGYVPQRLQYAGTPEDQPMDAPGIPMDMDMRFWNTAPADQQPERFLKAGDAIELLGLRAAGPLTLQLPNFDAAGVCRYEDGRRESVPMVLDTVHIDLDRQTVTLRFHGIQAFDQRIQRINVYCAPTDGAQGVAHG